MSWVREKLVESLSDKELRDEYAATSIRRSIAHQVRAMREARGLSQAQLGKLADKPQGNISRVEDPDYGRVSLQTLIELAAAFDVGLLVKFVPFSELLSYTADASVEELNAPSFKDDAALSGVQIKTPAASTATREQPYRTLGKRNAPAGRMPKPRK